MMAGSLAVYQSGSHETKQSESAQHLAVASGPQTGSAGHIGRFCTLRLVELTTHCVPGSRRLDALQLYGQAYARRPLRWHSNVWRVSKVKLAAHIFHDLARHGFQFPGKPAQERVIANDVDRSGNALRDLMYEHDGFAREKPATVRTSGTSLREDVARS